MPSSPARPSNQNRSPSRVLRTNTEDRLALDPPGQVEGGDSMVEIETLPIFVRSRPSARPPDNLIQLGAMT